MQSQKRSQNIASTPDELTLENAKATFGHLMLEIMSYQQRLDQEKTIKDNLYAFILLKHEFAELKEYERSVSNNRGDGLRGAIAKLFLKFTKPLGLTQN